MTDDAARLPSSEALPGPFFEGSPHLLTWLVEEQCAIAFTTYQAGRLVLIGAGDDGRLKGHERRIERCQGLWSDGTSLWVGGRADLWRFANILPPGTQTQSGGDRLYAPRLGYVTGDVDIHDIAVRPNGTPVFVSTRFSCLAEPDADRGFRPVWAPPFISGLTPDDRCHLNGLALGPGGAPAFVTAVARSDEREGWREHRAEGGVLIDVASGETVCAGLSMPHSPRLHDGAVWMLNSGTGELVTIDPASGRSEPVCFLPGFARGLAFYGKWAVVGLSKPRRSGAFAGLPLDAALERHGVSAACGLAVIDTQTGVLAHGLRINRSVSELYDVAILPGVRRPEALGFQDQDALAASFPTSWPSL